MLFNTYPFLSLSAILAPIAFSSPTIQLPSLTPNQSITQPTNFTSTSNDNLHCIDLLNPFSRRPKYSDCTWAIRQLPRFPATGAFHNQGDDDPFKLPVESTFSSCTVRVELLAASSTVAASWPGINTRANTLNRYCLRTTFPIYKGGWATYAKDERIVIFLGKSDRYGGGGSVDSAR